MCLCVCWKKHVHASNPFVCVKQCYVHRLTKSIKANAFNIKKKRIVFFFFVVTMVSSLGIVFFL